MRPIQNRSISAAAGTGKTYRLAHRYLGLLAAGVAPDRICALTFSRKAAGEIFDKIVEHICNAATDAGKRAKTVETIAKEGLAAPGQADAYLSMLRKVLDNGHRLRIGTLDSFILGVVRAFPLELGIPLETRPMDGDGGEAAAARLALLTRLFDPGRSSDREGRESFLSAFRQSRFGQEAKRLVSVFDEMILNHYGFYRLHRSGDWHWGDDSRIWQPGEKWWAEAEPQVTLPSSLPERLAVMFGAGGRPRQLGEACGKIAARALAHTVEQPWPDDISQSVARQLTMQAQSGGAGALTYYKTDYCIPAGLWAELRNALRNLIGVEVTRSLNRTRGLRAVLERYDSLYTESQRMDGGFTFEDLSRLLGTEGQTPSRRTSAPDRLYIDYRLDGKLDHWLLDEFQDTSDTQWNALSNLIDEVVQDESRSFFYVGDVKQSIYGWRGGNHRLFNQVRQRYNQGNTARAIHLESIQACHRSLPAVIDTVNKVFDRLADWNCENALRKEAISSFSSFWNLHESARLNEGSGFAALLEYVTDTNVTEEAGGDDPSEADDPAEFEAVARILEQTQPMKNGLTTAVLVRSNAAGRDCVDALRRRLPDMPCVHEGKGGIVDNPVVTVLLALVRYAAHPGDTVALRHLQMSPLSAHPDMTDLVALPVAILSAIHEHGFAETLRAWGARLGGLDAFSRQRLQEFLAAAEQFDANGVCDLDAFADFVDAYQVKASAAAGTIRVMTIHQSKGLGFDLVIVPFSPNAKGFGKPGDPKLLNGEDWVLSPPCSLAMEAAGGTPYKALETARADANFAQLCVLYVALTRAQNALYLVIPQKKKTSETVREADLLRDRLSSADSAGEGPGNLTLLYACGDKRWFERPAKTTPPKPVDQPAPLKLTFATEISRREPSKELAEGHVFPACWLFKAEAGDITSFGSAIHRLFQKVEWLDSTGIESLIAEWRSESAESPNLLDDVERQFRACVSNAEIRQLLSPPAGAHSAEVWREAPFELLVEIEGCKQLMSGRFDRLVVERDAAGHPARARIIDFKSNRISTEEEMRKAADGYAGQMRDYALAAGRLLGLPVKSVSATLLFTRLGRTHTL